MKVNFKRAGFAVLAGLMAAGSAMPVFAEGAHTITIQNVESGKTYNAYKVFDETHDGENTVYTINGDSGFYDTVSAYDGIQLDKAAGTANTYIVTKTDKFDAATFADLLRQDESKPAAAASQEAASDADIKLSVTDEGYYYIGTTTGAIASLDSANDDATVYDKNHDITAPTKTVNDHDVELGQKLNYTVTSKVPMTTGYKAYTLRIADDLPEGITYGKDAVVTIGGEAAPEGVVTINNDDADHANGFNISIDATKLQDKFGQEIKVVYTGTVVDAAVTSDVAGNTNTVHVYHPTSPTDATEKESGEATATSYSFKVDIDKYDAADETKKLAGAQFVLANADGTKFYKLEDGKVTWIDAANGEAAAAAGATVETTDDKGAAEFRGLEASSDQTKDDDTSSLDGSGKYRLYEIKAPTGYNLLKDPVEVSLARGVDADTQAVTISTESYKVPNSTGAELPETGSRNAMILTVIGAAGVGAIAIYLATRKKDDAQENA